MFELLAVIVQTDPAPIAGWMLLLLALGMYPVGLLFPGCCACGSNPCSNCPTGTLPDTVTVTFPEWDDEMLGEYRHRIAFSAPPGWTTPRSRASARVSETTAGAITQVEILDGGAGYALVGRVSPTLTISGGGGAGATFTPTLTSSGTPATWTLASATASGGSGYVDGSSLTITAANGDTTTTQAAATVVARGEPTITATAPGGAGASLSVTLSKSAGTPPTWSVSSVSVTSGGTGYANNASVSFSIGNATQISAASATITTSEDGYAEPTVEIDASAAGGTGAAFSVTFEPVEDPPPWLPDKPSYRKIASVAVTNGGTGYDAEAGQVLLKQTNGTTNVDTGSYDIPLAVTITDGAIASVDGVILYDEVYPVGTPIFEGAPSGTIESVTVTNGGSYYLPTGPAYGVTVTTGGSYYREDKAAPPYVATPTATVENASLFANAPSVTPVVDDDPYSATFGQIESVTINSGGLGHYYRTLNIGKRCCKTIFGGRSFVLRRSAEDPCQYVYQKCEGLGTTTITLTIPPESSEYGRQRPYLTTSSGDGCETTWTATEFIDDCTTLLWNGASQGDTLELESGQRLATVSPGGSYTAGTMPSRCSRCCTSGTMPDEVEVSLTMAAEYGNDQWDGTYVLEARDVFAGEGINTSAAWWYNGAALTDPNQNDWVQISLANQHCGEWTTPPGIRKQDPNSSTTLVGVRGGFNNNNGLRQSVGVIAGDFEKPTAPPPPYPAGWECPRENIDTPYADDDYPGTSVAAQDYVSHCGTDCSDKCFWVARVLIYTASNQDYNASQWNESKPIGSPLIHEEEAGMAGYLDKVIAGFEVFFDYFDIPYCGGAWVYINGNWTLQNPPVVDIANVWPGRDLSQATCEACESNLCTPSGAIEIKRGFPSPSLWATVTLS